MAAESTIEGISANLVALATRTDQSEALAEIKVPTRIIVGADDSITQPSAAQAMASKIPGADVHVLERVGHLSNLEAEQAFNSLLLEHLARLRS
jgi:pimeloyl-ACP methyl ester carboxylesterase